MTHLRTRLPGLGTAWLALIGVIVLIAVTVSPVLQGELHGTDPYSRLNRLAYNWSSGDWSNVIYPRSNWPHGELIHWTRAFDLILLGLAAPLVPFLGIRSALFVAGSISGPLLHIAGVAVAIWAALPLLRSHARRWVGLIFVAQPAAGLAFMIGRPDHHGLQLIIWMALLGACARLITNRKEHGRDPVVGGLLLAAGIWVSIEQLIAAVPMCGALAVAWVLHGGTWARLNARFWGACTLALAGLLLVDGPAEGILSPQYDRFSIVHVALTGCIAAFWGTAARLPWLTTRAARLGGGLAAAAAIAGLMAALFPRFVRGPFAGMNHRLWEIFIQYSREWEPVLSGRLGYVGPFFAHLLIPLGALALYAWRRRDNPAVIALFAATHVWFVGLILIQVRWSGYLTLLDAAALAMAAGLLLERIDRLDQQRPGVAALRAGVVLAATIAPFVVVGVGGVLEAAPPKKPAPCEWSDGATALAREPSGVVLANLFWGPPLLWSTDFAVIATPMHRNDEGILFSHRVMSTTDPDRAHSLLREREITHILWCTGDVWHPHVPAEASETFYGGLQEGRLPEWLTPVPTSTPRLRLARVRR